MNRLWPNTQAAIGTPYDPTVSGIPAENVQDAIDYVASNTAPPTSAPSKNTFIKTLRINMSGVLSIDTLGQVSVVQGTNQLNIVLGSARILANSGMEISGNGGIQIRTV